MPSPTNYPKLHTVGLAAPASEAVATAGITAGLKQMIPGALGEFNMGWRVYYIM